MSQVKVTNVSKHAATYHARRLFDGIDDGIEFLTICYDKINDLVSRSYDEEVYRMHVSLSSFESMYLDDEMRRLPVQMTRQFIYELQHRCWPHMVHFTTDEFGGTLFVIDGVVRDVPLPRAMMTRIRYGGMGFDDYASTARLMFDYVSSLIIDDEAQFVPMWGVQVAL